MTEQEPRLLLLLCFKAEIQTKRGGSKADSLFSLPEG